MKKQIQLLLGLLSLVVVAVYYWVNLPPINVLSGDAKFQVQVSQRLKTL
ncbi:hypothetical protein ABNB56_02915 [Streptococcus iniae]|nr:hypothetical protein [Streptococcus iniae]